MSSIKSRDRILAAAMRLLEANGVTQVVGDLDFLAAVDAVLEDVMDAMAAAGKTTWNVGA